MRFSIFRLFYILSLLAFLSCLYFFFLKNWEEFGVALAGAFAFLGIGLQGNLKLKGYTYAAMIFAVVTLAMAFPGWFIEIHGFKLANTITPLIQIIMFGMGTSMSIQDFAGVIRTPQSVLIGVVAQFCIMPLLGLGLATLSGLEPEIAAGLILIGSSPSGTASNVISYLAKANLALSVTLTACTTMLAPLLTPLLMKFLAGALVEIDVLKMMWDIFKMILIPIGAGLIFNKILKASSKRINQLMPLVSMVAIGLILIVITAAGRDALLKIGPLLFLLVLVHNFSGYFIGYWFSRAFNMSEKDCRTVAIEVGMQNAGLASGIAKEMGKIATIGLASAVFGPLMNISGSILATIWSKKNGKPKSDF